MVNRYHVESLATGSATEQCFHLWDCIVHAHDEMHVPKHAANTIHCTVSSFTKLHSSFAAVMHKER